MFKILDLFSGAGGFSFGFDNNENFKTVLANDFDADALKTLKSNNENVEVICGDITNNNVKNKIINKSKQLGVNFIIGGPPCQGFSMKGKKGGLDDERNFLFLEFIEIVNKIRPSFFVIENVPAILTSMDSYFIKQIESKMNDMGYFINYKILNASDFGVPQIRKRAFIIGSLFGKFDLPIANNRTKKTNVWDAISDLSYIESGDIQDERKYTNKPITDYQVQMRKNSSTLFNHSATKHTKETLYKLKLIPEKGTKLDLPFNLRTNQKFKTTWSRLHWDKPSPTIDTRFDTPSNGQNTHPVLNRAITPREAARIQSFPDNFKFIGKKTQICRQIGNAVPPLLSKAIANSIWKQIEKNENRFNSSSNIFLADSTKISGNFENETIDALITDPPYNISKKNNFHTLKIKRQGIDFGEWDKEFDTIIWLNNYYPKIKMGGSIIIFCSYLSISFISEKLISLGADVKDVIKWIKTNPMPRNVNRRYVSDTEFAIWAVKPGKKWTFNKSKDIPYLRSEIKTGTVLGKERTKHPTQKSLKLMEAIIKIHTNKNDIIIDPFMGSGTTGVAAKNLERKFIGIEKEKEFYNIALNRIFD
ncbi:MAG: DNA (cytosine-5-)-methyltransferase [Metamycoplasmataceae bacterium]